ncbi:hypothetical protein [Blastopirellula marina]|uniref:Uncharacterized protein n=1 Tax=Blastopirellula marina TaxID=124 RepID=A0A2S8GDB0_9BACT|nr:hypothetical protein [Blastopirellula marina]PQO42074.1 hypothetical protein C5Y93_27370 [Blastopirellula marina]
MNRDPNSIDWKNLKQGYGYAKEVPSQLAMLAEGSPEQQEEALFSLWESLYHQGSRFEASPFAVPFLWEILATADVPLQHQLIDFLQGLAVGLGEEFLPRGYDLELEKQRTESGEWPCLFENEPARDCYLAVQEKSETFIEFLDPSVHPETRLSASFAIPHFAEHLARFQGDISRHALRETDFMQLQGLVLCFGMLGRHAQETPDTAWLVDWVTTHSCPTIQVCASIALATIYESGTPDVARNKLFTALAQAWDLATARPGGNWWNEGDLLGYAATVLPMLGEKYRVESTFVLSEALEKLDVCTFAIPETLLDLLFPASRPDGTWKVTDLDGLQRNCLARLLRTRHWRSWMIDSLFFSAELIGDERQAALQQLIQEITGENEDRESNPMGRIGNVSSWDFETKWPKK